MASLGKFDVSIIGGGIIGLATARQLAIRHPKLRICVIEKERELASHQSKRNSGVVHSGIYYKKGSLKSKYCIRGARLIEEYCQAKDLPYIKCGKLIVATRQDELQNLHNLHANASGNGIQGIELISSSRQVEKIQPGCTGALEAIWSPNTAIVDWQKVAFSYASDFKRSGGTVITNFKAINLTPEKSHTRISRKMNEDYVESRSVVNCAGLYADAFPYMTGNEIYPRILPFKGNYYKLSKELAKTIRTNIYPVPDPNLPFLGVHVTPRVDGSVIIGPTAILSLGFERYDNDEPLRMIEVLTILWGGALWKMFRGKQNYLFAALQELRRLWSKDYFARDVQRLLPELKTRDLLKTKFCGIRAQAISDDGRLVDDFIIEPSYRSDFRRIVHVRNCPSPAATSSLALAERISNTVEDRCL